LPCAHAIISTESPQLVRTPACHAGGCGQICHFQAYCHRNDSDHVRGLYSALLLLSLVMIWRLWKTPSRIHRLKRCAPRLTQICPT